MNYQKIHDKIIEKAKSENRKKYNGIYYENHHIIPKSLGGSNKKNNLVLLTAREHFLIHWLLHEIYPENKFLTLAFNLMCVCENNKQKNRYKPSSRIIEYSKIKASIAQKGFKHTQESIEKIRISSKGRIPSEEVKKKRVETRRDNNGYFFSEERKEKIRESNKKRLCKDETKIKLSKKLKESWRNRLDIDKINRSKKISDSHKNKEKVKCPFCDKIGKGNIMKRYHFDKCKYKKL